MKKIKLLNRKALISTIAVLIFAAACFQVFIDVAVIKNVIQPGPGGNTVVAKLIGDAISQLNKPAPVDPKTGDIYIPQAHLYLPAYTGFGQIEYMYESGQYTSNNSTELHLTSSSIIDQAENMLWVSIANSENQKPWQNTNMYDFFKEVPSLQACTRGVQIFFTKPKLDGDFVFQGSHKVIDGRTLYVYSESGCKQNQAPIITLANKAQSY